MRQGGFAGDPAEALQVAGRGGCCGGPAASVPAAEPEPAQTASPCCGTATEAAESSACCGTTAKAEAVAAGAGCC